MMATTTTSSAAPVPVNDAISGEPFKDGEGYIEEALTTPGPDGKRTRFVSVNSLNMTHEEIEKAKEDGRIKYFKAPKGSKKSEARSTSTRRSSSKRSAKKSSKKDE